MLDAVPADTLRRRRLIVAGAVLVLVAAALIGYAVLSHRSTTSPPAADGQPLLSPAAPPTTSATTVPAELPSLPPTSEPEAFARLVGRALFEWDTSTIIGRQQHIERLVAVADPTGESSAGLAADVRNYLPTAAAWKQLQPYATRQWLEIQGVSVPSLWPKAEAQAGPDGLLPGTTAYTISGIRHRTGVWEGEPVSSAHDVIFTVFIVCAPTYDICHLLRLSRLNDLLE